MTEKEKVKIETIRGPEGLALYINDYYICGPKLWSGGKVTKTWFVKREDIERALNQQHPTMKKKGVKA